MNPSAYAVWRALVKYDLRVLKNTFFNRHIIIKIWIILSGALLILFNALIVIAAQFVRSDAPLNPVKEAKAMEIIVLSSAGCFLMFLFFSFLSGGMGLIRSTNPIIAPLPVHKGALYFHRVAGVCAPLSAFYMLFVPNARIAAGAGAQVQTSLLQNGAFYFGWVGILAFCAGLTIGVSSLLTRFIGMERSDKAFKAVTFLIPAGIIIAMVSIDIMDLLSDLFSGAVQSRIDIDASLYAVLPSTWAALALKDPSPIWQPVSLTALGAVGILFGYASFVRTFNIEEALALIEKKAESRAFQSGARRYGSLSAHIRTDLKLLLRNRKLIASSVFSLGVSAAYLSYWALQAVYKSGAVMNGFGTVAMFVLLLLLHSLEGRGVLSVRIAAPNMAPYAAAKALELSALIFVYTLAAFCFKTKAIPIGMDILTCALIGVGHGCITVGIWCAFPRVDEKRFVGVPSILCLSLYSMAAFPAFGFSPESAHVWIAAAVCASGVFVANQGRKRLESMDALW